MVELPTCRHRTPINGERFRCGNDGLAKLAGFVTAAECLQCGPTKYCDQATATVRSVKPRLNFAELAALRRH